MVLAGEAYSQHHGTYEKDGGHQCQNEDGQQALLHWDVIQTLCGAGGHRAPGGKTLSVFPLVDEAIRGIAG